MHMAPIYLITENVLEL